MKNCLFFCLMCALIIVHVLVNHQMKGAYKGPKINHKNGIQAGWYELRKSLYSFLESNTGLILRYAKGTHKWVLENIEINITWDVLYFGLVALNRKLGFPSREIYIEWKKGKYMSRKCGFVQPVCRIELIRA